MLNYILIFANEQFIWKMSMVYFWIPMEIFEIFCLYKEWDILGVVPFTKAKKQKHL